MKKKIVTILGARPQFIKTPLLSKEIKKFATEVIVHTGQHYDELMSDIFWKELKISKPKYNLRVGSATHGIQTGEMLKGIEKILIKEKPSLVLIYGDTNSTIAGALAASKLNIPIAHVESGMRSFNRAMPEEINRVVSDHLSTLLFCPTKTAVKLLNSEGIKKNVFFAGDVMVDIQQKIMKKNNNQSLQTFGLSKKEYILVTIHRQENTDNKKNLENIVKALINIEQTIFWPVHPRTYKCLEKLGLLDKLSKTPHIKLNQPVGYGTMLVLEKNAKTILTDSGGIQKEAYLAQVPCITLRLETEWEETVLSGWNYLVGTDDKLIQSFASKFPSPKKHPNFLGDGKAYLKIAKALKSYLS